MTDEQAHASIERQLKQAHDEGWDCIDAEPGEWAIAQHASGRTWMITPDPEDGEEQD